MTDVDFLECPLCFEIFTKVVETPCCHRCYCQECVKQWLEKDKTCPGCRAQLTIESCVPNIPFQRLANELPAKCIYSSSGCKDKITRGIYEQHIKACGYGPMVCEYGGKSCPAISKKDWETHKEQCPSRPTTCTLCSSVIPLSKIEAHLEFECPMGLVKCSNPRCTDTTIVRSKIKEHVEKECLYTITPCPFAKRGCKVAVERGLIEKHLEADSVNHLKIAIDLLDKAEFETQTLIKMIDDLQKEKYRMEIGISELTVLKPKLQYSPISIPSIPLILPSYLVDDEHKKLAYVTDNNIAGIKGRIPNSFSLFGSYEKSNDLKAVIIPADRAVPPIYRFTDLPYYFEITVIKGGVLEEGGISIGFVEDNHSMKGQLGFSPGSYGLNVFQQRLYSTGKSGELTQPKSYPGNPRTPGTFGCGWDQARNLIFFMVDGTCGGTAFRNVTGKLRPAIGLSSAGVEVSVNFGTSPFYWDSKQYWKPFREMEEQVENCIATGKCTYLSTDTSYFPQQMYQCRTCKFYGNLGMCEVCAKVCHEGHELIAPKAAIGFFCDCGNLTSDKKKDICKCLN